MKENLAFIKECLFDAPTEVKAAYNEVVKYFDGKGKSQVPQGKSRDGYKSWYVVAEVEITSKGKGGEFTSTDFKSSFQNTKTAQAAEAAWRDNISVREGVKKVLRVKAFPNTWDRSPGGKSTPNYDQKAVEAWEKSGK